MTLLSRRTVLTGLITAPAIVKPINIMPIFNIDDWNPYVLSYLESNGDLVRSAYDVAHGFQHLRNHMAGTNWERAAELNISFDQRIIKIVWRVVRESQLDRDFVKRNINHGI